MGIIERIGQWKIQQLQRAVARSPGSAKAWSRLHNYCLQHGRETVFAGFCQEVLRHQPDNRQAWSFLGLEDNSERRVFVKELARLHPDDERIWEQLDALLGEQDSAELIEFCERLVQERPQTLPAWTRLARTHKSQGRQPQVLNACLHLLQLNPGDAQTWCNLADAYAAKRKHTEAIAAYQKSLSLKPNSIKALNSLGNVYQQQGRHLEAVGMFEKAVKLNPDDATPWVWLCMAYTELGEIKKATEAIARVNRKMPLMGAMLREELAAKQPSP